MTIASILSYLWRGGGLLKPPPQAQELLKSPGGIGLKSKMTRFLIHMTSCAHENFGNSSKVFSNVFKIFQISENLWKSSEVFGNLRKFSENVGNRSKVIFRCFYDFLKLLENLREIFGTFRKTSETVQK